MKTIMRWLFPVFLLGCSSATFELGPEGVSKLRTDTEQSDASVELDFGTLDSDVEPGSDVRPDAAVPVDTWVFDSGAIDTRPDAVPDVAVDSTPDAPAGVDARVEIVLPAAGDTWATKYGPERFALVGDSVTGTRWLSGGQRAGSATLQTDGDGYAGHQMKVVLFIDGAKVAEDIAYPAQDPKFSFVFGTPMSSGNHTFEFRVVAVYSCVSPSTCEGGYFKVPNGVTVLRLE